MTAGQGVKLVNNLLLAVRVQSAAKAAHISSELGYCTRRMIVAVAHWPGNSAAVQMIGAMGLPEALIASKGSFIRKDIAYDVAHDLGVEPGSMMEAVHAPLLAEIDARQS